jgi:membrane-bound lytic murein transglycosylase B
MSWREELMMNLNSAFYLCAVFSSLAIGAQVMPSSSGSSGSASTRTVTADCPSTVPNAALDNATHPRRNEVEKQVAQSENCLKAIKRPLDAEEQKTADQIRTYTIHAHEALNADDLDGASTLSAKAQALLLKLSKQYSGEKPHVLLIN